MTETNKYAVGFDKYEGCVTIIGPDGFRVARMDSGGAARSAGQQEAIAHNIVSALNQRDELLEALQSIVGNFPKFNRDAWPDIAAELDKCRAAISKATGAQ